MINVKDAWSIAQTPPVRAEMPPLTEREWMLLGYLETQIDNGICQFFNGEMFQFPVPKAKFNESILVEIQRKYREGGWFVSAVDLEEEIRLLFAPSQKPEPKKEN